MKKLARYIGLGLVVLSLVYFLPYAAKNFNSIPVTDWGWGSSINIAATTGLYCLAILTGAITWCILLRAYGDPTRMSVTLIIFLLSQFAKYIPGKIATFLGRVALAKSCSLKIPLVIFTMTVEVCWVIAAASLMSLITLSATGSDLSRKITEFLPVWQIAMVGILGVVIPLGGLWLANRWRHGSLRKLLGSEEISHPDLLVLLVCFLLYMLIFLLLGLITNLLALGIFGMEESHLFLLTGITAVAWVAGFLTPGAPAGLGVREAVMVALMDPVLGAGAALGTSIAFRLVSFLGDGLIFACALLAKRKVLLP